MVNVPRFSVLIALLFASAFFAIGCGGAGGPKGDPQDQWLSRTIAAIESKDSVALADTVAESFFDDCNQVSRKDYLDGWQQLFAVSRTIDIHDAFFESKNVLEGMATVEVSGRAKVTFLDGSTEERDASWATRLQRGDDGRWRDRGQGLDQCPAGPAWLVNQSQ